jgi:transcriptional regulator with XRE-family HTH domain
MESTELQQVFFNTVKNTLPSHISMVDKIAEILNISYDSVYRRIRGEKPITIAELKLLCDYFHISLDQVLQINSDAVVFQAPGINDGETKFEDYLSGILDQLKYFNSFKEKEMFYLCKDLPIWHFYLFPEIAAFKTFCWIKTIQNRSEYQDKSFSLEEFPFHECFKIGQQLLTEYYKIPSVELWNFESLNSTIRQLEYYRDADLFAKANDFEEVLLSFDKMINHLQRQAEVGYKFMPGATDLTYKAPFKFYVNEVILGNNTIMVELDGSKYCVINYNVLSYLMTKDPRFTRRSFDSFHNLVSRSTMISGTGEKFRNRFFRDLRNKVMEIRV